MKSDSELNTAYSVFKKFSQAKQAKVIEGSLAFFKKTLDERALGKDLSTNGFNPIEKQLALLIIKEQQKDFERLGAEKMEVVSRLQISLKERPLSENNIASHLRIEHFEEEQIKLALSVVSTLGSKMVIASTHGRGDDEFSQVLRQQFSEARDLFLYKEPLAEKILFEISLNPTRLGGLQFILHEMNFILPSLKNTKPFWWNETHDTILEEALIRRVPTMIGEPILKLLNLFPEMPTKDAVDKACDDLKQSAEFAEFYFRARQNELNKSLPDTKAPVINLLEHPKASLGLYREVIDGWIFYYYEGKGSNGWTKQKQRFEFISKNLMELLKNWPSAEFDALPTHNRDQIEKVIAMLYGVPNQFQKAMDMHFKITEPGQTQLASRFARFLHRIDNTFEATHRD